MGSTRQSEKGAWTPGDTRWMHPEAKPGRYMFVGRWFDGLAVLVVVVALWVAWQTGLSGLWTPLILIVVGEFVWYGMSAGARYELEHAVEEVLEASAFAYPGAPDDPLV